MSDTPETNSRAWSDHNEGIPHEVVESNFARKLERERDEALMDRNNGDIATMTINHYERLIKERDEARKERDQLKQLLAADSENVDAYLGVCIERDEVQQKYDNLATEHMLVINKLCEERDEAREQVNRYRYNLDLLPIKWDI